MSNGGDLESEHMFMAAVRLIFILAFMLMLSLDEH